MKESLQFVANDVRPEGAPVDVTLEAEWLDEALGDTGVRSRGPGRVSGRLSRSGNDIVVRCRVVVPVEADCVRCLDPMAIEVDAELSLLLRPAPAARHGEQGQSRSGRGQAEEYEFSASEADEDVYDGETIVLDHFVREAIVLDVPNFPLCSEACPGIRPSPEPADEASEDPRLVDPRLAPLGAFRQKTGEPASIDELVAAAAERSAALGRKPILRSSARRARKKRK